jgi:ATP-binding cassette subfamily B protein
MQKNLSIPSRGRTENPASPAREGKESALRLVFRSPDLRRVLPGLGLSAFLSNILALALPLAILQILDRVVVNQSLETLIFLVFGVILALILEEVLRATNGLVTTWLGARFEHNASVKALEHLMHVPLQRYQREEPGAHAERILASVKVAEFYSGQALLVLFDLPFVALFLALIYVIGGWLVVVPALLLLLFTWLIHHFGNWMRQQVQQRNVLDDRRLGFLAEVLSGIHSVKTLTMEALMLRRYERLQEANSDLGEALTRGSSLATSMGTLFSQVMIVSVVFASSWLVLGGRMTPGGLAACMMLSVRALQPLRRGLTVWMRYQSFVAAHDRLNEISKMPCEDSSGKPPMPPLEKSLELRNITLTHSGSAPLFSNLSLTVEAGQYIAIRGDSGSGKTSLLSMMNGLVNPDSGEIWVDGQALGSFASDSVHRQIALLPQTGTIVTGNILENMTMFDASLNQDALQIAHRLGLDRIVSGMKLGYETPLGEGVAETLPAGVRQIITIIRALVRKPSVILFDEANISLDMRGDQLLRDYFAKEKGKCTVILVTHRPSLISLADKVYSLTGGALQEGVVEARAMPADASSGIAAAIVERPESTEEVSVIIQRQFDEESDLSICLLPLLRALEWQGQPRELAEAMPHLVRSLELSGLCSIMANLGLFPKHLDGNLARLDARLMPCLFVPPDQPAMVVLERSSNGKLRVFDSVTRSEREIEPTWEAGEIYLFQKAEAPAKGPRAEASWISALLLRFRGHIVLAFVLTVVSAILGLAPPLFVKSIYDSVLPSGDIVMGGFLMLGVVIVITVDALLRNLKSRIMAFVGGRSEYILGNSLFQRIIHLPFAATDGASVSQQVGRIKNLESLRDFFLGPLSLLAFELPSTLVLLVAIAIINPWVLLVVALSALAFTALGFFTRKVSERSVAKAGKLGSARWEFLNEALTDMRPIRSVGAGMSWVNRFREMSGKSVMANFRDHEVHAHVGSVAHLLGSGTGLLALALSAYLSIQGQITGGTMVATMMILWRLTGPMQNIFLAATSLVRIRANIRQVENLMRLKGESDTGVYQTIRPNVRGTLSFARVSFRYANDADPVLLGVSFKVEPGQVVVIAGGNGSGKSTLLKLMERLYIPQAGTVRLDNVDIRQLTAADLRAKISYMPQHCELFYGTVTQNLRLVHPAATDAEVEWAVKMAGLEGDIRALPEGFNTRISNSRSELLPHGFRQRLSLARTILKPAVVVLLDEPGTGMDEAGEEALIRCVEWLRGRSTLIMVSHRPGHMRLADNVILMEQGSVVAMGTFDSIKDKIMSGAVRVASF